MKAIRYIHLLVIESIGLKHRESGVDSASPLAAASTSLRSCFFNTDADRDAPLRESFFANVVPARRLAADLAVPFEHDIHGLRMWNNLGLAIDLDIIRAVEPLTVDEQGHLWIAFDIFDLIRGIARGYDHLAFSADNR